MTIQMITHQVSNLTFWRRRYTMSKPIFSSLDNLSLQDMHAEGELIPLMTTEDEEALGEELPEAVPILPLKHCLFPGVVIPITVGRDKSIQLIKDANKGDKVIGVVAQDQSVEDPSVLDIYPLDGSTNFTCINHT